MDPYIESSFAIELTTGQGQSLAYFSAITGGSMSVVVVEHTLMYEGGGSRGIYIPSCTNFEPITLSFGVTDNMGFWDWWMDMANGKRNRIDASIFALGPTIAAGKKTEGATSARAIPETLSEKGRRIAQWDLEDVWPSRISGLRFDADSDKYYLASVTLAVEDVKRIKVNNEAA